MNFFNLNFAKKDFFQKDIQDILLEYFEKYKPDLMFFQELNQEIKGNLKGYEFFGNNGVGFIYKTSTFKDPIELSLTKTYDFYNERILISRLTHIQTKSYALVVSVHAPRMDKVSEGKFPRTHMLRACEKLLDNAEELNMNIKDPFLTIIGGDFNTTIIYNLQGARNLLNKKTNPMWTQIRYIITDPTKDTTINGQSIDGIYCKLKGDKRVKVVDSQIIDLKVPDILDHHLQYSSILLEEEVKDRLHYNFERTKTSEELDEEKQLSKKVTEKLEKLKEMKVEKDEYKCVLVSGKYRALHVGPRGGKFYLNEKGSKTYCENKEIFVKPKNEIDEESFGNLLEKKGDIVKEVEKIETKKEIDKREVPKIINIKDDDKLYDCVLVSNEYRALHTGPRGGKYYFMPSGAKKYCESKELFQKKKKDIAEWSFNALEIKLEKKLEKRKEEETIKVLEKESQNISKISIDEEGDTKPIQIERFENIIKKEPKLILKNDDILVKKVIIEPKIIQSNFIEKNIIDDKFECVFVNNEYRLLHTGPRGGKYFLMPGGAKKYIEPHRYIYKKSKNEIVEWSFGTYEKRGKSRMNRDESK